MRDERAEVCSCLRDRRHLDSSEPGILVPSFAFADDGFEGHGQRSAALECLLSRTTPRSGPRYLDAVPPQEDGSRYGTGVAVAF